MWRRGREPSASNLVWIVGSPRTGTTWLISLLDFHRRIRVVDEPLIGSHLGLPAATTVGMAGGHGGGAESDAGRAIDFFAGRDDYFFSDRYRDTWLPLLRQLVVGRLAAQFAELGGDPRHDLMVVKEPHGSEAADVLGEVMPDARFLVVVRDGRDVLDSVLDALQPGAWASGLATVGADADERLAFAGRYSQLWVDRTRAVQRLRERHPQPLQLMVRYEDLLADTAGGIAAILTWLGLDQPAGMDEHIARLAFANMDQRGSGHMSRAATPGLWRTNLSAREQRVATEIMAPMLESLGYDA